MLLCYNKNKVAVDLVDQMVRMYSTRCATRRWPVGVWCNILDLAAQNSWIIYKKSTGRRISRKKFILELVEELRVQHAHARNPPRAALSEVSENSQESLSVSNKRKKCHGKQCGNNTVATCKACGSLPVANVQRRKVELYVLFAKAAVCKFVT